MRFFRGRNEVWMKDGHSPVSEADYAVDKFLRETLMAARPHYGWLSEETADDLDRLGKPRQFVVDPIDGTRGFLEGGEQWCVSIAVVEAGRPIVGVLQCPARKQRYWAQRGQGSYLDGARLAVVPVSAQPQVAGPRPIVEGFGNGRPQGVRRVAYIPSLAYRIALIAGGMLDATFVKPKARDWDLAAADLILQEAGGAVVTPAGAAPFYGTEESGHGPLVAGSGDLLKEMAKHIAVWEDAA